MKPDTVSVRRIEPMRCLLLFVVLAASAAYSQKGASGPQGVSVILRDVTTKTHLVTSGISLSEQTSSTLDKPIRSDVYSLEFARKTLIPSMGGSIATADFDNDGYTDVYLVVPGAGNHLFHGLKDGTFSDVTTSAKVQGTGADISATFADYDHSGRASLFVAGLNGVTLYRNNGDGTFSEVTEQAGLKGKAGELATSIALFDADGDGFLDALVTVYCDLSVPPAKSSFVFPKDFAGTTSRLYRNQHDGTFREVTEGSGLSDNPGRGRRALAADFTQSGRMDLLLLRDDKPPALYRNQGDFKFEEKTWDAGAENWKYAYFDGDARDFDRDGKDDIILWSTISNEVLINQGEGKFETAPSLPMVFAPNRLFGFHGIVANVFGENSNDLLTLDHHNRLHLIANRKGHFSEVPLSLKSRSTVPNTGFALSDLSALTQLRAHKGAPLLLVGVRMNGQVVVLESELSRRQNSSAGNAKSK